MSTSKSKVAEDVPVILFPLGGCEPAGALTKPQHEVRMKVLRERVRKGWNEPGVQAVIALLEMRGARMQKAALLPGATAHDAGQGYEAGQCVAMLRSVYDSVEKG